MERKELLPSEMQAAIGKQIQSVLTATNRNS
jgi:hypothetical protein